jgi:predicted RNase H-like nuclease (RuvC/YqgF family)
MMKMNTEQVIDMLKAENENLRKEANLAKDVIEALEIELDKLICKLHIELLDSCDE